MHAASFIFLIIFGFFTSEHKIEFLRLTVEELQALQAKGLIFLIFLLLVSDFQQRIRK